MRRSRDRGINFVKLNKDVIYTSQVSPTENNFQRSAVSFMPQSVRNIDTKAIEQRRKILQTEQQTFNGNAISERLERQNLASEGSPPFNSVDEQLR